MLYRKRKNNSQKDFSTGSLAEYETVVVRFVAVNGVLG